MLILILRYSSPVQLKEFGQESGGRNVNDIAKRHSSVDVCIFGFS